MQREPRFVHALLKIGRTENVEVDDHRLRHVARYGGGGYHRQCSSLVAGTSTRNPLREGSMVIWQLSRLALVVSVNPSIIASSSAPAGGTRPIQSGSTLTWHVPQLRNPPQSISRHRIHRVRHHPIQSLGSAWFRGCAILNIKAAISSQFRRRCRVQDGRRSLIGSSDKGRTIDE